jgi:hypothetical protein
VADNKAEPDEHFDVQLQNSQGATISDDNGRVIITEGLLTKTSQTKKGNAEIEASRNKVPFDVRVSGNPTNTQFKLEVESGKEESIAILVTDVQGKIIQKLQAHHPFQPIYLGANYKTGVYFAQVIQGNERRTVKLIKF